MPFLQRGEFLQRQRIDLAQRRTRSRSALRSRFSCSSRTKGLPCHDRLAVVIHGRAEGRPFVARIPAAGSGHRPGPARSPPRAGPAVRPSSSTDPVLQGLDPEPLLGTRQFVAVHGVRQFGELPGQGVVGGADVRQFAVPLLAVLLGNVALHAGQLDGHVDEPDDLLHRRGHGGGPAGLDPAAAGPFGGLFPGPAFGGGGPFQRRPPGCGWRSAAPRRCAATAGPPSRRTAPGTRPAPAHRAVPWTAPASAGASWAAASRAAIAVEGFLLGRDVGLGPWPATLPACSLSPTALRSTEFRWPSRSATAASRASESWSRSRAASARSCASARRACAAARAKRFCSSPAVTAASLDAASSTAACTSSSDGALAEPPVTVKAVKTSPAMRDRGQLRPLARSGAAAASRSSTTAVRASSVLHGCRLRGRRRDQVGCPAGTLQAEHRVLQSQPPPRGRPAPAAASSSSVARPASSSFSSCSTAAAAAAVPHHDGVRGAAEGGGDCGLVAGLHRQLRGQRPDDAGQPGAERRARNRPCGSGPAAGHRAGP